MDALHQLRLRMIERFRYRVHFLTPEQNVAAIRRILRNVDIGAKGCALWTRAVNNCCYPVITFRVRGQVMVFYAHQLAYRLAHRTGDIPHYKEIAHERCDTPPCVNPEHLELQRRRENRRKSAINTNAKLAARRAAQEARA